LTATNFLTWLDGKAPPDEMALHRYFTRRRDEGIGEGTLRMTYGMLKKLYLANGWEWPLRAEDRPVPPLVMNTPAFTPEEVTQLIHNRGRYSLGERFYLALGTIYAPKRSDLARIKKRDIKGNTILVNAGQVEKRRTHLVPEEITPCIEDYQPRVNSGETLTAIFYRICEKGLGGRRHGYGWDSFQRTLEALLPAALIQVGKPQLLASLFLRWGKKIPALSMSPRLDMPVSDPFFIELEVFAVHPFLPLWAHQGG